MRIHLALVSLALALPAAAQSHMEDCLWVASRGAVNLHKISRYGEVLQVVDMAYNGFGLRSVNRHPNGNLWVINYITATFTILDPRGNLIKNVKTTGNSYAVAFDRQGNAWVSGATADAVDKYDAAGNFISTHSTGGGSAPLGLSIDTTGNIWVANRVNAPGYVSKIDGATGLVTKHPLPTTSAMMPVHVLADFQGFGQPSNIWVGGDRSNEIVQMTSTGTVLNTYFPFTVGYPTGLDIDRDNNIWITTSNRDVIRMKNLDGSILTKFQLTNTVGGVTMDALGRPWVVDRLAPAGSEIQRYGIASGALETSAPVGTNTYGIVDVSGYRYAYVVNPFADDDGDGAANVAEILKGTSPFDPLSNSSLSMDTSGAYRLGQSCSLDSASANAGTLLVLLARKIGTPLPIPGIGGAFLLDPTTILTGLATPAGTPLPLPIPNDPFLAGVAVEMQGIFVDGTTLALQFTNLTGLKMIP